MKVSQYECERWIIKLSRKDLKPIEIQLPLQARRMIRRDKKTEEEETKRNGTPMIRN